jgi:hypothetical protein
MEIVQLGTSVRAFDGAIASPALTRLGGWTPMSLTRALLQGIFVGATLALFLAWLSSSQSHRYALTGPDCANFGKGGGACSGRYPTGDGANDGCVSLGRGGLFCKAHPGKDGLAG